LAWDAEWLAVLGLQAEQFPALADYRAYRQGLADSYRQRWPALADVPFYLAVGDGAAANVGSGAVTVSQAALTIGTTAALRRIIPQANEDALPSIPPGLWAYRVGIQQHLIGGATNEGGNIYQWASQTLALGDLAQAEAALASCTPGAHGLTFLPLLGGERSPGWRAEARGTLTGVNLMTTPLDILQAALEGVALRLRLLLAQLTQLGPVEQVYAGGGALMGSPAWAGMLCHALQQSLTLLDEPEVTARGVAILILQDLKGESWSAPAPMVGQILQPDPTQAELWAALEANQKALYHDLLGK
jgi:gluconokinase